MHFDLETYNICALFVIEELLALIEQPFLLIVDILINGAIVRGQGCEVALDQLIEIVGWLQLLKINVAFREVGVQEVNDEQVIWILLKPGDQKAVHFCLGGEFRKDEGSAVVVKGISIIKFGKIDKDRVFFLDVLAQYKEDNSQVASQKLLK